MNDELIVSNYDIKATPLNVFVFMQDKIVVDVDASLHANKDVLTEHLVKVIVPISRSAKGVLNIETPVASLSSTIASIAYSRATTTFVNKESRL